MGNIQARFSRTHSRKQKKDPKTASQNPTFKNTMPVYRTSKFTEHFDAPTMHLDDEMIEACPIPFPSKHEECSIQGQSGPLTPIPETRSSSPSSNLELSDLIQYTPSSQPAHLPTHDPNLEPSDLRASTPSSRPLSRAANLSPSSIYSRGTDDSKPLTSTPDSSFLKQEPAYFIHHTDSGEICDSRLLFENTAVPKPLLVAALAVLIGEVSLESIRQIDEYRFHLPRFNDYLNGSDIEKRGDEWHSSQKVFEKYENAVTANVSEETCAQILADSYPSIRLADIFIRGSQGNVEVQRMLSMDEVVERERGRSVTRRTATGAKGN